MDLESGHGSEHSIYTKLLDPCGAPLQWKELLRDKGYMRKLHIRLGK